MKKLFFTAVAVLAFSGAGFAKEKVVMKTEFTFDNCYYGAASAFNQVVNTGGTVSAAWIMYSIVLKACKGGGYNGNTPGPIN